MNREGRLQIHSTRHSIPHARAWNIAFRTLHIVVIALLVGGHAFGAPENQLRPLLFGAIGSGVGMVVMDAYPSFHFLREGWGMFLLFKLTLLCVIPFAWNYRLPILIAVVVIGSVGSHMPKKFRHYSPVHEAGQKK